MEFLAGFPFLSNYLGHWLHWGGGDVFAQPFIFLRKWKIVQFKMWCVCANVSKPLLFFHFLWLLWLKISQYHTISYKKLHTFFFRTKFCCVLIVWPFPSLIFCAQRKPIAAMKGVQHLKPNQCWLVKSQILWNTHFGACQQDFMLSIVSKLNVWPDLIWCRLFFSSTFP